MKFNKRGVSPVIAVLLLIVIAVAAAVLTYLWVLGYIGTVQSTGGTEQLQERIKIEGVQVDTTNNDIDALYVRNIGDIAVNVTDIYLSDASGVVAYTHLTGTTGVISPGTVTTLDDAALGGTKTGTVSAYTLTEGVTYIIKVVTEDGTEATYTFTYRK